jgi:hypothetical protein
VNARQILAEVKRRTLLLAIASGGELSHDEAEREAAKSVIAEARKSPRSTNLGTANPARDGVTPATARAFLTNYLGALSDKLRNPISPKPIARAPGVSKVRVVPRPYTHRATASTPPAVDLLPSEPAPNPVLVFTGTSTAAVLISDDEFHTSVHSHTTAAWRASIERNERIAQERQRKRTLWVG